MTKGLRGHATQYVTSACTMKESRAPGAHADRSDLIPKLVVGAKAWEQWEQTTRIGTSGRAQTPQDAGARHLHHVRADGPEGVPGGMPWFLDDIS